MAQPSSDEETEDARLTAAARAVFEEGLELADRGDWEAAADRFRRASEIRDSAPIRFNLAQSIARLGRLIEAVEMLRALEEDEAVEPEVRRSATELRRELEERIGRVTVRVPGLEEEQRIMLDDLELPEAALGVAIPIDPGSHTLRLMEGPELMDQTAFEVDDGQSRVVGVGAGLLGPDPEVVEEGGTVFETWWFWTLTGVVVAGGAVTAYLLLRDDEPGTIEEPSGAVEPIVTTPVVARF